MILIGNNRERTKKIVLKYSKWINQYLKYILYHSLKYMIRINYSAKSIFLICSSNQKFSKGNKVCSMKISF
jgi:hypothetical protein